MLYAIGRLRLLPRPLSTPLATSLLFVAYVVPAGAMLLYVQYMVSDRLEAIFYPLPWLADGVAIALMLLWGTRTWPGIFLGSIVVWGVMRGDPAITVGVDAVGETLSVVIAVRLMRAWHFRRQLDRLSDPLILLGAALAGRAVAMIADIAGTMLCVWATPHSLPLDYLRVLTVPGTLIPRVSPEFVYAIARWQLNALAGIALTVPALFASTRRLRHAFRARRLRLTSLGALAVLWSGAAVQLPWPWTSWLLLLLALMLVAWAAVDFGALSAALCTLLFGCVASAAFCQGVGPLAGTEVPGDLAATWGFIGLLCCVGPILTVLLSLRHHHDRRLAVLADRYRSLFTANPTPAWVVDAGSGSILMANAEAIRRYGYAESEFLRMRLVELAAHSPSEAELPSLEGKLIAAPLTKHLTRDGRTIDVELVSTPLELEGQQVQLVYAVDMTDHQDLRRRLLATADRESCRLSQELQDELGQSLNALATGVEEVIQRTERAATLDAPAAELVRAFAEQAQKAESALYQITTGASSLDDLQGDLLEALRRLPATLPATDRDRTEVVIESDAAVMLTLERREHLYRLVQESLANALKRARAEKIVIRAAVDAERIQVAVGTDVVCSFPQSEPPPGAARTAERPPSPAVPRETPRLAAFPRITTAVVIVLACYLGALVSHALASAAKTQFTYADVRLAVPSLVVGASVAALLLAGRRYWPAVLLGVALGRFTLINEPLATALLLAALGTATSYAVTLLLERWGYTPGVERWQDPLVLGAAAALPWTFTQLVSIVILGLLASAGNNYVAPGVGTLFACPMSPGVCVTPALLGASARWWFDALAGIVLVVPTVTLPATLKRALSENLGELCAWCACLACGALLLLTMPTLKMLMPLLTVSILLVVWAAARFGAALASLATLVFVMTAAGSFSIHTGALGAQGSSAGIVYVWAFTAVLTVMGLFLVALLAENQRRHGKLRAVSKRYRYLFQCDPRPLWLHDAHSGRILEANEPAAHAYGYAMSEFINLRVNDLLPSGVSAAVLDPPDDRAVGPLTMKHRRREGGAIDVELWSYGTFVDGRRVSVCFAHDVTERNTLRRLLFDRAELESRELATELRRTLAAPLAELRIVAHKVLLELARHAAERRIRDLLESLVRQARRAAQSCREVAHRLSPLQANRGDLAAALEALRHQHPDNVRLEIDYSGNTPLSLDPQQSEHVYGLLREIVGRCRPGRPGQVVRVAIASSRHMVRLSIEAELPPTRSGPPPSLAQHPSVLLRARAMGARLWEFSLGGTRTRVVCDLSL